MTSIYKQMIALCGVAKKEREYCHQVCGVQDECFWYNNPCNAHAYVVRYNGQVYLSFTRNSSIIVSEKMFDTQPHCHPEQTKDFWHAIDALRRNPDVWRKIH